MATQTKGNQFATVAGSFLDLGDNNGSVNQNLCGGFKFTSRSNTTALKTVAKYAQCRKNDTNKNPSKTFTQF